MVRASRYVHLALAWAFVAGLVLQVYFIGLALFGSPEFAGVHADFGWAILHLSPLLILVSAPIAQTGRTHILLAAALAITVWLVPILAAVRADVPVAAAFHPLGALLAFGLAIVVARRATSLVGSPDAAVRPTRWEWVGVTVLVVILLTLSFSGSPTEA